ncbi:MAG: redoxin domain-containing protein [Chitinivibrionales bacterium]|nr:redoxin domain-containing protein [Chitinivibrionales bacterium]
MTQTEKAFKLMFRRALCIVAAAVPLTGAGEIYETPSDAQWLSAGDTIPEVSLTNLARQNVLLPDLVSEKPIVMIVYRGGWCPYCNKHFKKLKTIEDTLLSAGFRLIAVSPDRISELEKTSDKHQFRYELYSDSSMAALQEFGLVFRVDDETLKRYDKFGIDLNTASGKEHNLLPIPAVYIIDTGGIIRFAYANPDYKTRLDEKKLLKAATNLTQ